ncbi:MAG TPA: type II toxin-antitoxin system PrlF family antitoxin [Acidiferrobacterales bacterium]|jgi:AbrB family looped-hinge helix DNA binding protein
MSEARLSSKGQITIPRDVRERLKLKLGDKLRFRIADNGQVVLEAAQHHVTELYGLLRRKGAKPVSVEAMDEAIRRRFKRPR